MMKVLAFSIIQYGSVTWLGNPAHEKKINSLLNLARRKACRAPPGTSTALLEEIIPPTCSLSEWCTKINKKWLAKAEEKNDCVKKSIKRARKTGIKNEGMIKQEKRLIRPLTPLYHLTKN